MGRDETLAAFRRGDDAEAESLAREDLADATASGDAAGRVDALCMLARVALRAGDLEGVAAAAREAQDAAGTDPSLGRMPLHLQAVAARMSGRFDEGRALYTRSIELNEQLGQAGMAAAEHRNLAYLELRAGDLVRARELLAEAARRFSELDVPAMAPYLAFDRARVAALDEQYAEATRLLQTARALWEEQGAVPDPDDAAEVAELERLLGDERSRR